MIMNLSKIKGCSLILLIMMMCAYSLNTGAESQSKKKKKNEVNEVKQVKHVIPEEYGKTVTLVTSGSGATEDDATKNALRNALEQAYGTFVSSNTTIVNDELVNDAITSISSGNVLGYEQISSISTPDGFSVSVKAVVSIGDLVTFATSRGMTAELAGNTFLMNRNLARLNKENERAAIKNLVEQLSAIVKKGMYDYTVETDQPRTNDSYWGSAGAEYAIDIFVHAKPNANFKIFWETIHRTLSSLSMSSTESANYGLLEMETYVYSEIPSIEIPEGGLKPKSGYILRNNIGKVIYGRVISDEKTEIPLLQMIAGLETQGKYSYELYDNLGNIVRPTVVKSKIGGSFSYRISGFHILGDYYYIGLRESRTTQHRVSRDVGDHEKGMSPRSFIMQYNESELSKLRNFSVRPHVITFENYK